MNSLSEESEESEESKDGISDDVKKKIQRHLDESLSEATNTSGALMELDYSIESGSSIGSEPSAGSDSSTESSSSTESKYAKKNFNVNMQKEIWQLL
jgi:hypothetical protein